MPLWIVCLVSLSFGVFVLCNLLPCDPFFLALSVLCFSWFCPFCAFLGFVLFVVSVLCVSCFMFILCALLSFKRFVLLLVLLVLCVYWLCPLRVVSVVRFLFYVNIVWAS